MAHRYQGILNYDLGASVLERRLLIEDLKKHQPDFRHLSNSVKSA